MSAHDHREFVEGCYRCDLSRDEASEYTPTMSEMYSCYANRNALPAAENRARFDRFIAEVRAGVVAEEPESVREEWYVLGHPRWPGGIDFPAREQAEAHYWSTPKLDGTRDGMRLMHRTITRYPEWVPVKQEGESDGMPG